MLMNRLAMTVLACLLAGAAYAQTPAAPAPSSSRPEREARSGETFSLRQAAYCGEKVSPRGVEFTPSEVEGGLGRDDGFSCCQPEAHLHFSSMSYATAKRPPAPAALDPTNRWDHARPCSFSCC